MNKSLLTFSALFMLNNFIIAQHLDIGMKAPEIKVDEWVNSNITDKDLKGKIIVLDFWFVQCAPCVASIPHMNKLADTYKNNDVVFIAITFDKKEAVNKFLSKMIMIPSVGLDTLNNTIKAFGVSLFPATFVIDKDGVIKWHGSPFDLNESLLHPIIKNQEYVKPVNYNPETGQQNSIYKLDIKIHNLEMGTASYSHHRKDEINIFNSSIKGIIGEQSDISSMRILTIGKSYDKPLDVILKVDDKYTTLENNGEMLIYLLQKQLNIDIKKTYKVVEVWNISAQNDTLIQQYVSKQENGGTSSNNKEWEGTGVPMDELIKTLENQFHMLIYNDTRLKENYDLKIPLGNFEEAKMILEKTYGFKVDRKKRKIEFVTIDFTKTNLKELGK